VKRSYLGLVALAVAVVVVFAPRPWGNDSQTGIREPASPLIGRVLAPTIDGGALHEQRYDGPTKDSGPFLWLACAIGLALAIRPRRLFDLADRLARVRSNAHLATQPTRAPPSILA
jgi:di/tricarboxylate transporter